jgi:hypothetical protein
MEEKPENFRKNSLFLLVFSRVLKWVLPRIPGGPNYAQKQRYPVVGTISCKNLDGGPALFK